MPDEREVLKDFLVKMSKTFEILKLQMGEKYKTEFLEATKETEQFYFPGVIEHHYNCYFFKKK